MSNFDALSTFETSVATQGYEWVRTLDGPVLMPRPDSKAGLDMRYRPFSPEHATLFREFSHLKVTQDAILAFANRYGLLGGPVPQSVEHDRLTVVQGTSIRRGELFDEAKVTDESAAELQRHGIWVHSWTANIKAMAAVLSATEKLRSGETLWDGPMLSLGPSPLRVVPTNPKGAAPKSQSPTRMLRAMEGPFIADRVSARLRQFVGTRLEWISTPAPGRFRLEFAPNSLIGCLWLQLAMALAQQKKYATCLGPGCKRLIEISLDPTMGARADALFCSGACKSRDYRHRKTRARALAGKGKSLTEIAKTLRSDSKTVRSWVKNQ